ncbi:MAG: leucine-rich repeat protein, partial [Chloroflexi bacterium]|nr:leucine-rich repeat protein [Chloroflexota bacterium]
MLHATSAQAQAKIWSATLTLDQSGSRVGCSDTLGSLENCSAALSDNEFTYDGSTYTVDRVYWTGQAVRIGIKKGGARVNADEAGGIPEDLAALTLYVDGSAFPFSNSLTDETNFGWRVNPSWSNGQVVQLSVIEPLGASLLRTGQPHPSLSAVPTANGTTLTLTYDQALNGHSVPPATAFTVKVDGETVRLASSNPVSISGSAVTLSLAEAVDAGQWVTVGDQVVPGDNRIYNSTSYYARDLFNQPVAVSGICGRTPVVRDAIMSASGVSDCADIASSDLGVVFSGDGSPLNLSNKGLTSLQEMDFRGLSYLTRLYLNGNALTSLPANVFDGLSRLEWLYLNNNALTSLPANVFDGLSSLQDLYLDGNSLSSLPADAFDDLSSLRDLFLQDNSLSSLPENVFHRLSGLSTLNLSNNPLSSLPENFLDGLSRLQTLGLRNNSLSRLPEEVFDGLSSLQTLLLTNNSLSSLPADVFDGLSSLQELTVKENSLTSLPWDVFGGLSSLQRLFLDSNSLSSLPPNLLDGLSTLKDLKLDNNSLRSFPTVAFRDLTALNSLQLEDNYLTCLTSGLDQKRSILDGATNNLPNCPTVSLSASPSSVREGSPATITATLSEAASRDRRISLWTTPGTAETRENYGTGYIGGDDDYVPLRQIIIPAGQTSGTGIVQTIR